MLDRQASVLVFRRDLGGPPEIFAPVADVISLAPTRRPAAGCPVRGTGRMADGGEVQGRLAFENEIANSVLSGRPGIRRLWLAWPGHG